MLESAGQFVLLEHVRDAERHWDLMFEAGSGLATWQLSQNPIVMRCAPEPEPIAAQRIVDHRRAYLDYQGPISGGRGFVTRLDRGHFQLIAQQPQRITLDLRGEQLFGKCEFNKLTTGEEPGEAETWTFGWIKP